MPGTEVKRSTAGPFPKHDDAYGDNSYRNDSQLVPVDDHQYDNQDPQAQGTYNFQKSTVTSNNIPRITSTPISSSLDRPAGVVQAENTVFSGYGSGSYSRTDGKSQ